MRRTAALVFVLTGLVAVPLGAQGGRYGDRAQGIPPGQLPPAGECRVWYNNLPPGRQPPPINCRDAERIASRDRDARVIYGASRNSRGQYGYERVPYDNGYKDGYDKGRGDAGGRHAYDPVRQSRYRSADHGYDRRYGSKDEYKNVYRDGFRAGYDQGYRDADVNYRGQRPNGGPWPY